MEMKTTKGDKKFRKKAGRERKKGNMMSKRERRRKKTRTKMK